MKKILLFLTLVVNVSCCILAQDSEVKEGNKIIIESALLSDSREILVALPSDYSSQKKYPVSYILDGEDLFEAHRNIVQYLSSKNVIPQMIVVGIVNKNRIRDLTHVPDSLNNIQPNGGGEKFESYITNELVSYIDSNYSTAPYRLLTGHSISGLFATKLLLNGCNIFNAYLIMDPSLWWAEMEAINSAKSQLANLNLRDTKLFLSIANSLPTSIESVKVALLDTTNATIGIRSVYQFRELLNEEYSYKTFWKSQYYESESHGTVPLISSYDGLKFIYDFYKRPSFQTLTDSTHIILDEHYKMLSEKMGYTILPPVFDLSGLAWRCRVLEKKPERAFFFLELYLKYYPTDPLAHMQMGEHFELIGEKEKAQEYYKKGKELGYEPNE